MYCYVYDYDVCTLPTYVCITMYARYYPVREEREKGEEANSDCLAGVARGDALPTLGFRDIERNCGDVTTHRSSRLFFLDNIYYCCACARARERVLDDRLDRGSMKEHTTIAVLKHIDSTKARNSGAQETRESSLLRISPHR